MNDTITTGLTNVIQLILLLFWKSIYVYYLYVMTMLAFTIINNILNARIVDKSILNINVEENWEKKKEK